MASPEDIGIMMELIEAQAKVAQSSDHERFMELDDAFHHAIAVSADCQYGWHIVENLKAQMDRVRFLSLPKATPIKKIVDQHRSIAQAIEKGDRKAACAAVSAHLGELLAILPKLAAKHADLFTDEDDGLAAWIEAEVACPCTMVDRIVPATTESDRLAAAQHLGVRDVAVVVTEPFSQWVIEDCSFPSVVRAGWRRPVKRLARGESIELLGLAVAAWMRYACGVDEQGRAIELSDPLAHEFGSRVAGFRERPDETVTNLLAIRQIFGDDLPADHHFCECVKRSFTTLCRLGARETIGHYLQR